MDLNQSTTPRVVSVPSISFVYYPPTPTPSLVLRSCELESSPIYLSTVPNPSYRCLSFLVRRRTNLYGRIQIGIGTPTSCQQIDGLKSSVSLSS